MAAEMSHYGKQKSLEAGHGTTLKRANWYKEIVFPAFREHDLKTNCATLDEQNFDLSSLGDALPLFDVHSDGEDFNNEEWTSSSEEQLGNLKTWSDWGDTDDEAEEANATDDMFKILEGDWS
ncbi:hypothetical protein N7523_005757 [Penicillium sp. IBT 18751x]|nr:hypothetical protein N7523_005757 [Penicillium sp. IBT 18751x]